MLLYGRNSPVVWVDPCFRSSSVSKAVAMAESQAPSSSRLGSVRAACSVAPTRSSVLQTPADARSHFGTVSHSREISARAGSLGLAMWQYGRNTALGAAEYMTPVLVQSQFAEKGVLTPDEFVAAGDMLVLRCPTWQWQAGDPTKARPFLPADKQFLLTRNVPCQRRACTLGAGADDESQIAGADGDIDDEGWVATHTSIAARHVRDEDAPDMEVVTAATASLAVSCTPPPPAPPAASSSAAAATPSMPPGLEECEELEEDDPSALGAGGGGGATDGILRTRTYDVSMSYDKYYQCARVWLYGYSESRQPLTQGQILEDISTDHALKTVSLEAHPHISTGAGLYASIHPCKHAAVMQKLTSELRAAGRETKPEQYLFLFLKFISAVCPTIEYDYTMSVDGM